MKKNTIAAAVTVVCLALLTVALAPGASAENHNGEFSDDIQAPSARTSLRRAINFHQFKSVFNKSYKSLLEEMSRQRLFISRSISAIVSYLRYLRKRVGSYLAVNQMSDWREEEFDQILIDADEYRRRYDDEFYSKITQLAAEADPSGKKIKGLLRNPETGIEEIIELDVSEIPGKFKSNEQHKLTKRETVQSNGDVKPKHQVAPTDQSEAPWTTFSTVKSFFRLTKKLDASKLIIDHRKSGCLQPVRNQGQCGSCYIFSVLALYEWMFCKNTGKKESFSEQYVLDCGTRINLKGCVGGFEVDVGQFVDEYGVERRKDYPYLGRNQSCPYDQHRIGPTEMGFGRFLDPKLMAIPYVWFDHAIERGPILATLDITFSFAFYGGGIDTRNDCSRKTLHSVLIVGDGKEDGIEYWLIRNSYSRFWGEDGHYRLSKNSKCIDLFGRIPRDYFENDSYFHFIENRRHNAKVIELHKRRTIRTRFIERIYDL